MSKLKRTLMTLTGRLPDTNPFGIVAQFDNPHELLRAAETMRDAGYREFDVHSPFPIHGMNKAMGIGRSLLPWIVLGGGMTGCAGALTLMIWINVVDYPIVISGKPYLSLPAFIPIVFELTVLLSAFAALGGMLLLNFLPMLYHPLMKNPEFARATSDGFFLSVEAWDPRFDPDDTRRLLESAGGRNIALLEP
jgi:hypothetical protein